MGLPGYAGHILFVDLTVGSVKKKPLDPGLALQYIGGSGLNVRLASELVPPDTEPLSPGNAIILGAGPFNGTLIPGSSRLSLLYKSPLNGSFIQNSGGGNFSGFLKSSGYDHLVFTGRSRKPVYLKIQDHKVELLDAGDLWGKDSFATTDELRLRHEPCSILPIGQAGENLVNISVAQIDKGGTVGSGGLAAVMGSKNLKAIVAMQGTEEIKIADPRRLKVIIDELLKRVMNYHLRQEMMRGGAMTMTSGWLPEGVLTRNSSVLMPYPPGTPQIQAGIYELHKQSRRKIACMACPMSDKDRLDLTEKGFTTYDSAVFAETAIMTTSAAYGTSESHLQDRYADALRYVDMTNRYGIDRLYSFQGLIDFVVTLYEEGVLTGADTGVALDRSFETLLKLVRMTAFRGGFGDILADGILGAARRIGRGADRHVQNVIKGQFVNRDPRLWGLGPMEFEMLVYPGRPLGVAAAMGSATYNPGSPLEEIKRQALRCGVPEEALKRIFCGGSFNIGRLARHGEDFFGIFNMLGQCHRLYISRFYSLQTLAELYTAVTGAEATAADLKSASDRAWNLWKLMNARAGFARSRDEPPEIWFQPLEGPGRSYRLRDYFQASELSREDVDRYLDDYYDERDWDKTSGLPTAGKLEELGLSRL